MSFLVPRFDIQWPHSLLLPSLRCQTFEYSIFQQKPISDINLDWLLNIHTNFRNQCMHADASFRRIECLYAKPCYLSLFFVGACVFLFALSHGSCGRLDANMHICNICSLFCLFACAFTAFGSSDHLQESLDNIQKLQCFVCLFACLLACLHCVAHPCLDGWDANMQQLKPHWISRHLCFKIGCAPILAWYPFLTVYISNI